MPTLAEIRASIGTDEFLIDPGYRMICGSAEAQERTYELYRGKSGKLWLVACQQNAGDNIYCSGGPKSNGFAGRTLTFPLAQGLGSIALVGPWHSNAGALLTDTGVDVTDKFWTFGVIGTDVRRVTWHHEKFGTANTAAIITGVIHRDEKEVLGSHDRIDKICKELLVERNEPLFKYVHWYGGSCNGFDFPKDFNRQEWLNTRSGGNK